MCVRITLRALGLDPVLKGYVDVFGLSCLLRRGKCSVSGHYLCTPDQSMIRLVDSYYDYDAAGIVQDRCPAQLDGGSPTAVQKASRASLGLRSTTTMGSGLYDAS